MLEPALGTPAVRARPGLYEGSSPDAMAWVHVANERACRGAAPSHLSAHAYVCDCV